MFPGGIADKVGNRYEAKLAVLRLLEVIFGRADAIRYEGLDKAAHGFEFELHRNGIVEWYQAKRRGAGNWTLKRLETEGVLTSFGERLAAASSNQCVFVSGDPAKEMSSLTEKAALADGFSQFNDALPDGLRATFGGLQTQWNLTPAETFAALRRCQFITFPDTEVERQIAVLVELIFENPSNEVFANLREYLEKHFNRLISTETARSELAQSKTLRFRNAALDPTLRERMQDATERYLQSYIPFGCAGHIIERHESGQAIDLLCQTEDPAAVLLTGVAGSGKSGVIRGIIEQLRERDVPVLAVRIDRALEIPSDEKLGEQLLDQHGNPCITLSRLFPSTRTIMIIDQIDAISEASGRAGTAREIVFQLIDTAQRLGNVRLILACRSFDLDNDARLKNLAQSRRVQRLDVPTLDWEQEVKPVLSAAGVAIDRLTRKQRELLTLPLNLAIYLATVDDTDDTSFASTTDLFDRLVEHKDRALRQRGPQGYSVSKALAEIARSMSTRQLLDVPQSVLDDFPGAVDFLTSEHLITRQRTRIAFFHESFFDYAFSRDFVRQGQRITDFLASDEQHLFRRTQVRQILTAYRQAGDQTRYLSELRDVLHRNGIRYHLKDAVARWLGTMESPTEGELRVILDLDRDDGRLPALLRYALVGNPAWFPLLQDLGILDQWLTAGSERQSEALIVLETASRDYPDEVAILLRTWWNKDAARSSDLLNWFSYLRERKPSQELLKLYLDLIRSHPQQLFDRNEQLPRHELTGWIKNDPPAAGEVLKAWFEAWFKVHPASHPFEREADGHLDLYWIGELAKASPAAFLRGAVTGFVHTIERIAIRDAHGEHDWTWRLRHRTRHLSGSEGFLEIMRNTFRKLAAQDTQQAGEILSEIDPESHPAALYLHLEAIAGGGQALARRLLPLLPLEGIFDAGPNGTAWLSFAEAARSALPHLSAVERDQVEQVILNRWPEIDLAVSRAQEAKTRTAQDYWSTPKGVVHTLNYSGSEQWAILKTIGAEPLTPGANQRLAELDRKFAGEQVPEPNRFEVVAIGSPIPKDRAGYMTDEQWLEAMRTHTKERSFRGTIRTGRGGAEQLATVLQILAKEQPARFARLMSRIPDDSPQDYQRAILWGLTETEGEPDALRSAIENAHGAPGRPFGQQICRLIEKNPSVVDDAVFDTLCWYVEHGDADEDEAVQTTRIEQDKLDIAHLIHRGSYLHIRGMNDVRGAAAEALGAVIWDCPERLEAAVALFTRRIETEPLASVRCCLMKAAYSVLRHDQERAANLVRQLVIWNEGVDLAPLMTHAGYRGFYYILHSTPDIGQELLDQLLASDDETARLIGAHHLFREAFGDDRFTARADDLIDLDLPHRLLAADVAAGNLNRAASRSRAETLLLRFFEDPDPGVRREVADCFRDLKDDDLAPYRPLMASFIASRAFEEENFAFFLLLKETACNVREEVIAAAERLIEIASRETDGKPHQHRAMHYLDDLIIREYAGLVDQPDQRRRMLDIIDRMLELGLYGADQIVAAHERV